MNACGKRTIVGVHGPIFRKSKHRYGNPELTSDVLPDEAWPRDPEL